MSRDKQGGVTQVQPDTERPFNGPLGEAHAFAMVFRDGIEFAGERQGGKTAPPARFRSENLMW